MKRSEVNDIIATAKSFADRYNFKLPPWAYWGPEDWRGKKEQTRGIVKNMLGWDITDFGSGNFPERGLTMFTIRNGSLGPGEKRTYCEKLLISEENQETPTHYHYNKVEDIINRGGGNLVVEVWNSDGDGNKLEEAVEVTIDAIPRKVRAGEKIILTPGESVCLWDHVYHRFYGEAGKGTVLIGEVSKINDDTKDNHFHEEVGRFPEIEEDEEPIHLLVGDYPKYV